MSGYVKQQDVTKVAEAVVKEREKAITAENESVVDEAKAIIISVKSQLDEEVEHIKSIKNNLNQINRTLSLITNRKKSDLELTSVGDAIAECDDSAFRMHYTEYIMPEDEESGLEMYQKKGEMPYYIVLAYARGEFTVLKRRLRNIREKNHIIGQIWVWDKGYQNAEVLCWSELPPIPKKRRKKPEEKTE